MISTSRVRAQFLMVGDVVTCNGRGGGAVCEVFVDPLPYPNALDVVALLSFDDGSRRRVGYKMDEWVALA